MTTTTDAEAMLTSWWQYFDYCFNVSPGALVCEGFWLNLIAAFVALGVLAVAAGVWKYLSYRRKFAAAIRAQWLREQADESEIREFAWKGDTPDAAALTEEQLAANIRAAMEERKREAAAESARRSS
jgi:hypothetical protein